MIFKRPVPPDDHLQEAGPFRWSFARGKSLRKIICRTPAPSRRPFARGRSHRIIICKRPVPLDDHLQPRKEHGNLDWLNCALRVDEAIYWIGIGHQWLVLGGTESVWGGNWCYWVSGGHWCLYILNKVEIWSGVTNALPTDWQTLKNRATQLLISIRVELS